MSKNKKCCGSDWGRFSFAVKGQRFLPSSQGAVRACAVPEAAQAELAGSRSCPPPRQILPCLVNPDISAKRQKMSPLQVSRVTYGCSPAKLRFPYDSRAPGAEQRAASRQQQQSSRYLFVLKIELASTWRKHSCLIIL